MWFDSRTQSDRDIRKSEEGFVKALLGGLIGILVLVLVFAALINPIQQNVSAAQNNTTDSGAKSLEGIIVLLVVVALIVALVSFAIGGLE